MDTDSLNKEIEKFLEDNFSEESREVNNTKKLFKKAEKNLLKIVKHNLEGKMGECWTGHKATKRIRARVKT